MLAQPENHRSAQRILERAESAAALIPPAWPLTATVAVNPFLGHGKASLAETSETIRKLSGHRLTMPVSWFLKKIGDGEISDADISEALKHGPKAFRSLSVDAFKAMLSEPSGQPDKFSNILDLATLVDDMDWAELATHCIGTWAASYFDAGQALWTPRAKTSAWNDWRIYSRHDLTPEIYGLKRFAEKSDETPNRAFEFILSAVDILDVPEDALEAYFHHLLFGLLGWSQFARYRQWQAELAGDEDDSILELLAIRLFWEVAVYQNRESSISAEWHKQLQYYGQSRKDEPSVTALLDEVLQSALDHSVQRKLISELAAPVPAVKAEDPIAQIAFCIDVRSEPMRRAIETCSTDVETLGFAGFFGLPIEHDAFASDVHENRLPVLLSPGVKTRTEENDADSDFNTRYVARAVRAWGRFKLAAVSSFAFVEAAGALYVGKLADQQFLKRTAKKKTEPKPAFAEALDKQTKTDLAKTILGAMSLTSDFRDLVVLCGHGANVTNNPHESALHCGACGGYSGEVNARLLALLLNDPETRAGLVEAGIAIPQSTVFLGALHDTTTDAVQVFHEDAGLDESSDKLSRLTEILKNAAMMTRTERQLRLPGANTPTQVTKRSADWSQTRPEWGLAGCRSFIAAPRERTLGRNLNGEAFLHTYDWRKDQDFKVLELILTAPVVVASWISLQYFGSTVAPELYGAGNKLLHNVVGGIGVLEGNGGPLRTGLPIQSVHNGEDFVHLPVRLSVFIEAPTDAINDVLSRHEAVRQLFDNGWLHLFAMNETGCVAQQYAQDLQWRDVSASYEITEERRVPA